jgi:hypothetical protein
MFLLFAKLGKNSNIAQPELSPNVQWMEFGPSSVTVLLNISDYHFAILRNYNDHHWYVCSITNLEYKTKTFIFKLSANMSITIKHQIKLIMQ